MLILVKNQLSPQWTTFKPRHHVAEKYYRTEISQLNEWMNFFYETYQIDSNITGVQYTGLEIFDRKGNTHRISKSKKKNIQIGA